MNPAPLLKSDIPGARLLNRGKVRDIYDAGDHLVLVTSDRISAFDVVMDQGIPAKGIVLTQISKFWFSQSTDLVKNHFVSDDVSTFPEPFCNHERGRSTNSPGEENVDCRIRTVEGTDIGDDLCVVPEQAKNEGDDLCVVPEQAKNEGDDLCVVPERVRW